MKKVLVLLSILMALQTTYATNSLTSKQTVCEVDYVNMHFKTTSMHHAVFDFTNLSERMFLETNDHHVTIASSANHTTVRFYNIGNAWHLGYAPPLTKQEVRQGTDFKMVVRDGAYIYEILCLEKSKYKQLMVDNNICDENGYARLDTHIPKCRKLSDLHVFARVD